MMKREMISNLILRTVKNMCEDGLVVGTAGNISLFDDESKLVWITPSAIPYKTMSGDDLVAITLDGDIRFGKHKPSSEWQLHTEIYKNYPHVNAVVHTHAPYATSFAVSNKPIPFILIEMCKSIGGNIPVAGFGIPGTKKVGEEAVKALKERNACLLQNHGVVTIGKDLDEAYTRMLYVEDVAKVYHFAIANGSIDVIDDEYQKIMLNRGKEKIEYVARG